MHWQLGVDLTWGSRWY